MLLKVREVTITLLDFICSLSARSLKDTYAGFWNEIAKRETLEIYF